jgi:hypothetical protein
MVFLFTSRKRRPIQFAGKEAFMMMITSPIRNRMQLPEFDDASFLDVQPRLRPSYLTSECSSLLAVSRLHLHLFAQPPPQALALFLSLLSSFHELR